MKFHQKHMITQPQENNKKQTTLHHQTTRQNAKFNPQKTHRDITGHNQLSPISTQKINKL
jgi:hypothetical protein